MEPVSYRWIDPQRLSDRWGAEGFVFESEGAGVTVMLGALAGRIQEGHRGLSSQTRELGYYRPLSIRDLRLHDDSLPPSSTDTPGQQLIGPGDIVLSKFLPVRAGWVTPSTRRRPIDSNCILISGLSREESFWIANLLEHPHYQRLLSRQAGRSVQPRLGVRELRELRVPPAPPQMASLGRFGGRWGG